MLKWFSNDTQRELDTALAKVQSLKKEIERLNGIIENIDNDVTAATPMIDFDSMRIFSIERIVHNGKPATIIGHWQNDPVVSNDNIVDRIVSREWNLYCNNEQHAALVERYNAWKAKQ